MAFGRSRRPAIANPYAPYSPWAARFDTRTSRVIRVVLRLRVLSVAPDHLIPTWDEITSVPPPK